MSINSERIVMLSSNPLNPDRPIPGWTAEISLRSIAVIFPPTFWGRMCERQRAEAEADDLAAAIARQLKALLQRGEPEH